MDADRDIDRVLARAAELERLARLHADVASKLEEEARRLLREADELITAPAAIQQKSSE